LSNLMSIGTDCSSGICEIPNTAFVLFCNEDS
jgi:hypothetical protein